MTDLGRPGTSFFAPQMRVIDPTTNDEHAVAGDITSTRVTLVHHGVSSVEITLNNQRFTRDRNKNPATPIWKYNDLATIAFGQRLRVDVRYGEEPWKPLILARVTDLQFAFPQSAGATLKVVGEDMLSLLKIGDPEEKDKNYQRQQEREIVADIVRRAGATSQLPMAAPVGSGFAQPLRSAQHQQSQTFLQFVQQLAERIDYELFVEFDDTSNTASPVKLHFEPARSRTLGKVVDVEWGRNLIQLNPRFKVWEQFTKVKAKGSHPELRRTIEQMADGSLLSGELHAEAGQPAPIDAVTFRHRFYQNDSTSNPHTTPVTNLDEERARWAAQQQFLSRAREFLTATGSTLGFPQLRPGLHLNVKNMYAPFDGLYYVTQAVHALDASGYRTDFTLRRPGMLDPKQYPKVNA